MVLFSNFRSPQYISALKGQKEAGLQDVGGSTETPRTPSLHLCLSSSPFVTLYFKVGVAVPELGEAFGPDVLTGVLNTSQQVGDELVDGAFILHGSRDALSNFNLVTFTVKKDGKIKLGEFCWVRTVLLLIYQ